MTDNEYTEQIINMLMHHPDMGYQEIAEVIGCSRQYVHRLAKNAGLTRDTKPRRYRSDVNVQRVLELYHQRLLVKDIAKALSCNQTTARKRLWAAGICEKGSYCPRPSSR